MNRIKLVVAIVTSLVVVVFLAGCQPKEEKMREFLKKYGNITAEKAYKKGGFLMIADIKFNIGSLEIKSIQTDQTGGVTYHIVKARIIYDYDTHTRQGGKEKFYRWMALTIEEDVSGNMLVDPSKSKEIVSVGINEKDSREMFPDKFDAGENLIR